ncbi:Unknown (plasmid) [Rickettsia africae ESF-5]|uniref:Uncharacterized protein n=1 Tax=Rickettsia africae (strain ESF-5) TaxID=347255 RepID=C3PPE0_RICAE|nr:hypothetical protein [Rickettsia africae]ACP54026.1 Unknown [Rickettsia africae ESF-5]
MYGLVRDERNITWLEVAGTSHYRNHDFKEAIESFDRMFEVLKHEKLGIPSMQKVIKAISCIDVILSVIGVNLFSIELEYKALKTKCKGLILLEEYEEIAGIHLRLNALNESLKGSFVELKEVS